MNINEAKQRSIGAIWILLVLIVFVGSIALAQTVFNRFGPSDGIMVGDAATYQTTSATSSDVLSLWSGTCADTTFLRGDGSCQVPPPTTGTGIPGGLNTYVQYNNAGSFSGDAGLTYNDATNTLTTGALTTGVLTSTSSSIGAATASSLTVSGNADLNTIDGIAVSDFARLSQLNNFTAAASASGQAINVLSAAPGTAWVETDAAANNQRWDVEVGSEQWCLRVVNDAIGAASNIMCVDRTGITVDTINLTATNVQANGSAVCRQNSTGCPVRQTACTVSSVGAVTSNIANCASASRGSAGSYLVNFTSAYGAAPICYGNASGGTIGIVQISVTNTGSVGIDTRNFTGTLTDMAFTVACVGN